MRHRVHAGGSRQDGRQAEGQFGVTNGRFGHDEPAVKADFATVVQNQNRAPGHFAAGAAGGGHSDDGCHTVGDLERAAFYGGVGFERAFVAHGNGHALGAIDGRAAAHRDQAVAAVGLVRGSRRTNGRLGRVGGGLVKHRNRQVGQGVEGFLQHACCFDACVGDDQGFADAHTLAFGLKQLHGAKVDLDLGDVVDERHAKTPIRGPGSEVTERRGGALYDQSPF